MVVVEQAIQNNRNFIEKLEIITQPQESYNQ